MDIYTKAKKMGEKEVKEAVSRGEYPYLPALDYFLEQTGQLAQMPVGLCEIPLSMVVGTKTIGRSNVFSRSFKPILGPETELAFKWNSLYRAQMSEGIRDPVKVYEYMWKFYVEEGNKRVSVLKYLDMPEILADVVRLIPKYSEEKEVRVYYEFMDFYKVAPLYEFQYTEPGCYRETAAMLGQDLENPWPEEAVQTLRSAYRQFETLFKERGGEKIGVSVSDAFFIYTRIFRLDSLVNEPEDLLKKRVNGIWSELVSANPEVETVVAYEPGDLSGKEIASAPEGVLGGLRSLISTGPKYTADHPLRIAFIQEKNSETSNWTYAHNEGRKYLDEVFEGVVETLEFENCDTDEEIRKAVEAAAADEDEVIITTSPSQMPEILRQAVRHPKIRFLNCSVNLPRSSVRTYSGRLFEAKFLMGCIAATQAENHKIGYIEHAPLYGTLAGINAFAIGAALIDPQAEVYLAWRSQKDTDWRAWMREQDIRVFSGPDFVRPEERSREFGIYRYTESGKMEHIASPVCNWGLYYKLIIRSVLNGSWRTDAPEPEGKPVSYWWGMSAGVIDVKLSDHLSYQTKKLIDLLKKGLMDETLNPFEGELRSQSGVIKGAGTPRLSYEEIITMNWLADNVIGRIPEAEEIRDDVKKSVDVNGIRV